MAWNQTCNLLEKMIAANTEAQTRVINDLAEEWARDVPGSLDRQKAYWLEKLADPNDQCNGVMMARWAGHFAAQSLVPSDRPREEVLHLLGTMGLPMCLIDSEGRLESVEYNKTGDRELWHHEVEYDLDEIRAHGVYLDSDTDVSKFSHTEIMQLAHELTGWYHSCGVAGGTYRDAPVAEIRNNRLVVSQTGGLDI